ncbi:MAG TPA: hypothetical protein VF815_30725 [Myxococcaceae bacterium]
MNVAKCVVVTLCLLPLTACWIKRTPPPEDKVSSLSDVLGKGWECYASPSGFNAPGTIFSLDTKGVRRDEADLSSKFEVQEADRVIGEVNVFRDVTMGTALSLLKGAVKDLSLSANANLSAKSSTQIKATQGKEERILHTDYREALKWARENPDIYAADRRVFLVRHTFKTSSIDYVLDSTFVGALGGEVKFKELATLSSNLKPETGSEDPAKPLYTLRQTFTSPLRMCVLLDELRMPAGVSGPGAVVVEPVQERLFIDANVQEAN